MSAGRSSARGCARATWPRRPRCSTSSRPAMPTSRSTALLREVSPAALGGEARAHVVGITGPPGAGKSTLLGELVRAWRADGRSVAVLAVDPSSRRSGGVAAGRPRAHPLRSGRRRRLHPLDRRRRAPRRAGARHARRRPGPGRRLRHRGRRDRRRRPERDRCRRGGRHRRGHRPARLGRRPAVPQGGDHGDPRRARGDEGRPRRRWPSARGATCTRPCARSAIGRPRWWRSRSIAPVSGIDELVAALDAHRARLDLPARRLAARRASALADFVAEHGERGPARPGRTARGRAGAGRAPTPAPTCPPS